jgi:hypothetical protein
MVRKLAESISELTGESLSTHLTMAQINLWREAANRFTTKVNEENAVRKEIESWWIGISGDAKSRVSKKYFGKEFYELTKSELEEILYKEEMVAKRFTAKDNTVRKKTESWWIGISGDAKSRISEKYFGKKFYELTKSELYEIFYKEENN